MSPPVTPKGTINSKKPPIGASNSMQGVIGEFQKNLKSESCKLFYFSL